MAFLQCEGAPASNWDKTFGGTSKDPTHIHAWTWGPTWTPAVLRFCASCLSCVDVVQHLGWLADLPSKNTNPSQTAELLGNNSENELKPFSLHERNLPLEMASYICLWPRSFSRRYKSVIVAFISYSTEQRSSCKCRTNALDDFCDFRITFLAVPGGVLSWLVSKPPGSLRSWVSRSLNAYISSRPVPRLNLPVLGPSPEVSLNHYDFSKLTYLSEIGWDQWLINGSKGPEGWKDAVGTSLALFVNSTPLNTLAVYFD